MRLLSLLFTVVVSVVAFAQVPTITNVSPKSGNPGTSVTITGTNFVNGSTTNNVVYFGSIKATVTAATSTSLTVTVPQSASNGKINYSNISTLKGCTSDIQFSTTFPGAGGFNVSTNFSESTQSIDPVKTTSDATSSFGVLPSPILSHGDLDLDGKVDLVIATGIGNTSAYGINIYKNSSSGNGNFTFATPVNISSSSSIEAVAIGDVTLDGKLDIVMASPTVATNSMTVLRNTTTSSTITFATGINIDAANVTFIEIRDINNDGKADVVFKTSANDKIYVSLNTSTTTSAPSFATPTILITTSNIGFELGDINNDTYPDLMVATSGARPKYYLNNGFGSFPSLTFTTAGGNTFGTYGQYQGNANLIDIDGDGLIDFAGRTDVNSASLNTTSGGVVSFANTAGVTCDGCGFRATGTIDMDGDGDIDLVGGAPYTPPRMQINRSTSTSGTISFSGYNELWLSSTGKTMTGIAVDLDNNGRPEFIQINGPSTTSSTLSIVRNKVGEILAVDTHPSTTAQTYCQNAAATALTITASGSSPTYQWEQSANGSTGWANVSAGTGATTTSYTPSTATAGTLYYRCKVTDASGSIWSNASGAYTVNAVVITTQPTTTAIVKCYGDAPQALTVATSSSSPTYQWQESTTSNGTYSNVTTGTGGTTSSFSPLHSNISWGNTKYYRCVITSNGCTATSNASAGYTIGNLAVTSNPSTSAQTYCQGASATPLTMTASANGLPITYMWQSATSVGGSYGSVVGGTGASTNTYTPPTSTAGTLYYRCYISYCGGQATASAASGAITVNVNTASAASSSPSVCINTAITNITHTTTGATGIGTASGLPAGVTAAWSSNTITVSGTPTASGTFNYTIPLSGGCGSVNATGTITLNGLPTITTQPTTTAIVKCYGDAPQALTVATSASSPTYQWQESTTSNGTYSDVTTGTGGTTSSFSPLHSNISWGNTKYYRCVITSNGCTATSNASAGYTIGNLAVTSNPSTTAQTYCQGASATPLTMTASANGLPITYMWQSATSVGGSYGSVVGGTGASTNTYTPPTSTAGTLYYRCYISYCSGQATASAASGAITVTDTYTWTGATSTDPTVAGNWNPAAVPCSGANEVIPSGLTNYPVYTNLTIDAGTTLTVQSGAKMDISGVLTNNGTLTIESGATLVQGASSTLAGSGTYNVKQNITGAGSTTPSGRFWYLGSPVSLSSSSVYFGNAANVVKKRDEATNAWITVASGTPENLVVGKGYYTQAMANSTINFTGGVLNNGAITINGLTRTSGQGFEGFNLVSNPYPSYLNWDDVTKTNVDGTMWYRTNDGSNMVFDTYVAGSGGIGTNLGGTSVTKFIPPMQSFWVRVSQGQTSGSLTLGNAMRSHFSSLGGSVAGLKSTNDEPSLFLRMNLLQAGKKDQLIVYVNETATNGFDALDGEKMMQAGYPQFYTKAGDKKIVINGLNSAKKQQALPITLELPTTGVHSFIIEDLEISNGLVWLEDKQEEIIQALEPGTVYEFFANSGMNSERFVLHFQLIDDAVPTNVYNEVNSSANFSGKGANVHAEAAGVVVIKLPASTEGITDIQIRDAAGRLVYTGSTNTLETSVKLEQANGIYYVTLNSTSGVEVRKVFIQQ